MRSSFNCTVVSSLWSTETMAQSSDEEKRRKNGKPSPDISLIPELVSAVWLLQLDFDSIVQLESYDDANFYLRTAPTKLEHGGNPSSVSGTEYLIKFHNAVESDNPDVLRGISLLLTRISTYDRKIRICDFSHPFVPVPLKIRSKCAAYSRPLNPSSIDRNDELDDTAYSRIHSINEGTDALNIASRLFRWISGPTLDKATMVTSATPKLMINLGFSLGSITNSLEGFDHPAFHREHCWDLQNFASTYTMFSIFVIESDVKDLIDLVFKNFVEQVMPVAHHFRQSVIMGDCNDANVITNIEMTAVTGIIDFGDAVYTWTINEIAIAMAYALLTAYGQMEPLKCIGCIFGGYISATSESHSSNSNMKDEINLPHLDDKRVFEYGCLHTLICMRLCLSIMIGSFSISKDPSNEYLKLHSYPSKQALKMLMKGADIRSSADTNGSNNKDNQKCLSFSVLSNVISKINSLDISKATNSIDLVTLIADATHYNQL